VLQIPVTTQPDSDLLFELEEALADELDDSKHEVDGYDVGSGTGNVFVHTNDPIGAFALAREVINPTKYPLLKAGFRLFDEDEYTLIWPPDSNESFNLI
jgi:hypothetical protein